MKLLFCLVCWLVAAPAWAEAPMPPLKDFQAEWARLQFATPQKEAQEAGFADLARKAESLSAAHPVTAEPLIWQGIALSSQAQLHADMEGLRLAEKARDLLLASLKIDPNAMQGAANVTLGALYYQVPGWPLGFGDAMLARQYLERAVAANPEDIDAHYFYGDFLYRKKQYVEAAAELEKALATPPQPGAPIAEQTRRADAKKLLSKARRRR